MNEIIEENHWKLFELPDKVLYFYCDLDTPSSLSIADNIDVGEMYWQGGLWIVNARILIYSKKCGLGGCNNSWQAKKNLQIAYLPWFCHFLLKYSCFLSKKDNITTEIQICGEGQSYLLFGASDIEWKKSGTHKLLSLCFIY